MLIDEYLPSYDYAERHSIGVDAPSERVWNAIRELDLGRSPLARVLFLLRGLPTKDLTLEGLINYGFLLLGERPREEILVGIVGRFWLPRGDVVRIDPGEFAEFDRPGYAKAAWNFSLAIRDHSTRVSTETRIACIDDGARRLFRFYWVLVRPFSGLIRKEALRTIKHQAEN